MAKKSSSKSNVQKRLKDLHGNLKSWKKVSEHLSVGQPKKIDRAMLCRIGQGKQRAPNVVLIALGLPPRMEMAQVCPVHGTVHIAKRCPSIRRPSQNRLTDIELQAVYDALLFTGQHAGLVSDAHIRAEVKIKRRIERK